ncbi:MAG: carboxypeptidase regulatory-like domain-containing protein [Planctomycetes bacterium]|nr:carboxypeptidase regulatory-like domain-containing protein [Planctomycetota bacterium]
MTPVAVLALSCTAIFSTAVAALSAQQTPFELRGRVDGSDTAQDVRILARFEPDATEQLLLGPDLQAVDSELPSNPERRVETTPTARGTFRIARRRPGTYVLRAITQDGHKASEIRRGSLGREPIGLTLRPASTLRVATKEPLAYSLFAFDRELRESFLLERGVLSQANAPLAVLPPGAYELRLVASDLRARDLAFVLGPGEDKTIETELRAPAHVRIRLPGATGRAIVHVPASVAGPTEPNRLVGPALAIGRAIEFVGGEASIALPGLDVTVQVTLLREGQPELALSTIPLASGSESVLELEQIASRELVITAAKPGRAVLLQFANGQTRRVFDVGPREVARGGIAARPALLLFFGDSDSRLVCESACLPSTSTSVELPATMAASVRLEATNADGFPLRSARVRLWPLRFESAATTGTTNSTKERIEHSVVEGIDLTALFPTLVDLTDRRGHATFDGLPPGRWLARIDAPPHASVEIELDVRAGVHLERSVRLELGHVLEGRVLLPSGQPAEAVLVEVDDPLPSERVGPRRTWTDALGRFVVTGLTDGTYRVEASRSVGVRRELARRSARPGADVQLRLYDEDPVRR